MIGTEANGIRGEEIGYAYRPPIGARATCKVHDSMIPRQRLVELLWWIGYVWRSIGWVGTIGMRGNAGAETKQ